MIQTCGGAFLGKGLCECANMPFTFNISEAASVSTIDWCKQDTALISMVCSWRSGSWSESLQSSQPCCLTWNLQHTALLLEKKCQRVPQYPVVRLWGASQEPCQSNIWDSDSGLAQNDTLGWPTQYTATWLTRFWHWTYLARSWTRKSSG